MKTSLGRSLALPGSRTHAPHVCAFTLIELLLVMAMLATVLAVAAPSLSRFFRGRSLDSEAKRFLALTRYGQSRAVSEGIPMLLWIDQDERSYGLRSESSYEPDDPKALDFRLAENVEIEIEMSTTNFVRSLPFRNSLELVDQLPSLRFTPEGGIAETSPEYICFRQADEEPIWIGPARDLLSYEIQTNQPARLRR